MAKSKSRVKSWQDRVVTAARAGVVDSQLHWVARMTPGNFRKARQEDHEFDAAIRAARAEATRLVGNALFELATGLRYTDDGRLEEVYEVVFDKKGNALKKRPKKDVIAAIFWLKSNGLWRENKAVEVELENGPGGAVKRVRYSVLRREDLDEELKRASGDYDLGGAPADDDGDGDDS